TLGERGRVDALHVAQAALGRLGCVQVAAHQAVDGPGERVVHDAVEHFALQPPARGVPDLADDVGVRSHRTTAHPELAPEVVVIDLCGDVQAPAVRPEPGPVGGDVEQELPDARVGYVQLGQRGQVPPRLVAQLAAAVGVERVPVDEEPVQVAALLPAPEHAG